MSFRSRQEFWARRMTITAETGGVWWQAEKLSALNCEYLTYLECFLCHWHCSKCWKKREEKGVENWRSKHCKECLTFLEAFEVGGRGWRWYL